MITLGLYKVRGIKNTDKLCIEPQGTQSVPRTKPPNFDKKIKTFEIDKRDKDVLTGSIYECVLTHFDLERSNRLPILYLDVVWTRPLVASSVCRVYLLFEITAEIGTPDDLFNKELSGIFSIQYKEEAGDIPLETLKLYPGHSKVHAKLRDFILLDDMIERLFDIVLERKKKFAEKYSVANITIPKNIIRLKDIDIDD